MRRRPRPPFLSASSVLFLSHFNPFHNSFPRPSQFFLSANLTLSSVISTIPIGRLNLSPFLAARHTAFLPRLFPRLTPAFFPPFPRPSPQPSTDYLLTN